MARSRVASSTASSAAPRAATRAKPTPIPVDDPAYHPFLAHVEGEFLRGTMTNDAIFAVDTDALWEAYLRAFPVKMRRTYTCSACRHFVTRFGGLVSIDDTGVLTSLCWNPVGLERPFSTVAERLQGMVERRPIGRVFLSRDAILGTPTTGPWSHLSAILPSRLLHRDALRTPGQRAAQVRESVGDVERTLETFSIEVLETALTLLESERVARAEKFVGPVKWLWDLQSRVRIAKATKQPLRANAMVWKAVASAPEGFLHTRAGVVGQLLEGIQAKKSIEQLQRDHAELMHPLHYQRPTAPLKAGNVAQAEKVVETLGLERALERRYARLEDCETSWLPAPARPAHATGSGVFSHLAPTLANHSLSDGSAQTMTWEKFQRLIVPQADTIAMQVPAHGAFIALTTATHADAPPILKWDREDARNPVAWYVWIKGSPARQWGLSYGEWRTVTAIVPLPTLWGERPSPELGEGAVLVLDGARDANAASLCLFPEMLRSELHAVRGTIEAHSASRRLTGGQQASACGYDLRKGNALGVRLRVTSGSQVLHYIIDRWD